MMSNSTMKYTIIVVNSSMFVERVIRYSRPMKIVVVPNLCEFSVYSNTNLAVCSHEGERIKL